MIGSDQRSIAIPNSK